MASFTSAANLEKRLASTAEMHAARERAAARVAETAQSIAPVGDAAEDDHPGQFRDAIHAEGTRVIAGDPASVSIIFGTEDTPPHDTLRRAAEMNGLRVHT